MPETVDYTFKRFPPGVVFVLTMNAFQYIFDMMVKSRTVNVALLDLKVAYDWLSTLGIHKMIHGGLIFYGGWMADSYLGKYLVYVTSVGLETFVYTPLLVAIMLVPYKQDWNIQVRYLVTCDLIRPFINFGIQLKDAIIAEQYLLPKMLKNFLLYLYCDFWMQNLGTIIALGALPSITNLFNCLEFYCIGISHVFGFIVNCIYFIGVLKLYGIIFKKKHSSLIIEKMIYCTFGSLTEKLTGKKHVHHNDFCCDRTKKSHQHINNTLMFIACCAPFWALRRTMFLTCLVQANQMNNYAYYLHVEPIFINGVPCLINLLLLPVSYRWIYPASNRNTIGTPLKSFGIAYGLIGCALLSAVSVNLLIDQNNSTPLLKWGFGQLKIYNGLPYDVAIQIPWVSHELVLRPYDLKMFFNIKTNKGVALTSAVIYSDRHNYSWFGEIQVYERESISYLIKKSGLICANKYDDIDTYAAVRPKIMLHCADDCGSGIITFYNIKTLMNFSDKIPEGGNQVSVELYGLGDYMFYINEKLMEKQHFDCGEIRSILLYKQNHKSIQYKTYLIVQKYETNILYMIPQCIFLALADIFSYVPYHFLLYHASPPHLRGFCYSVNEVIINIGVGIITLAENFFAAQLTEFMLYLLLVDFLLCLIYLLFTIKVKLHYEYE